MKPWLLIALAACGPGKQDAPATTGSQSGRSGSGSGSAQPAQPSTPVTPRAFLARGTPTFIVGTAGDDHVDRAIAGQVDFVRSALAPTARRVADTELDLSNAPAWPDRPIVYGGAHVNALVAALTPVLPLTIDAGKLAIGGQELASDELAVITVVPARAGERGHPELLLFAGTGTPGVEEINSSTFMRVDAPIVVADAFGPLMTGTWVNESDGSVRAELGPRARRVGWRSIAKEVAGIAVTFRFWDGSAPDGDAAAIETSSRGIATVAKQLAPSRWTSMTVYVHPDKRSKAALTGNAGDGHAVPLARTLHVYAVSGLESLVAHEATHVIAPQAWGPTGSVLFGEGLAVWIAGQYGGIPFAKFEPSTRSAGPIRELLGASLRNLPEREAYPLAALIVAAIVKHVGLANVRDHLYGATAATWDEACKRAGTTAAALDTAVAAALARD